MNFINLFQKILPNLFKYYGDAKTGQKITRKLQTNGFHEHKCENSVKPSVNQIQKYL